MPVDGGPALQIATAGGYVARESPDGKTLYFTNTSELSNLFAMPTAGGEERKVFAPLIIGRGFQPVADGIYYATLVRPQTEIRFHDFATGKDRTIGTFENFGVYLSVSPDRKFILCSGSRRSDSDIVLIENFR